VVHEPRGEVIVSGEEGPVAVVSPVPGTSGIQVCVPGTVAVSLRERIVGAFAPKPGEPSRDVSVVVAGPTVPAPGAVRFPPRELLNAAHGPRKTEPKSPWTAPLEQVRPAQRRTKPTAKR
jgi:hypothetical protein